ncbi:hypothetical protein V8F06_005954 [Rhypophila decipiens]
MSRPDDLLLQEIGALALAHLFSGNYAQALRMFESMCDRCREYEGESHCPQFVLRAKEGLATARGMMGIGETEHEFQLVIDLEKRHLGEEHPDIYTTYRRFAIVLATRGRVEDAQRWYSQAATGRKETSSYTTFGEDGGGGGGHRFFSCIGNRSGGKSGGIISRGHPIGG